MAGEMADDAVTQKKNYQLTKATCTCFSTIHSNGPPCCAVSPSPVSVLCPEPLEAWGAVE